MAAPTGNKFWELRSKHGRDKLFASPELLWESATEYFAWCEKNPISENGWAGTKRKIVRPFTLTALCLFLGVNTKYFHDFKKSLPEDDKDFSEVITRIEGTIYTQKFEGATVGIFNANIIARDLGLSDKQEQRFTDKDGNDRDAIKIEQVPTEQLTQLEKLLHDIAGANK